MAPLPHELWGPQGGRKQCELGKWWRRQGLRSPQVYCQISVTSSTFTDERGLVSGDKGGRWHSSPT